MVDLGCGTGVVGICAGVLGANVLLTDMDHALDLPRRNQARNLQAIKAGGGESRVGCARVGERRCAPSCVSWG